MKMARKQPNLLLCFDAFGTLFRPRHSVAQQYGDVARRCGLSSPRLSDEEVVEPYLRAAVKTESARNPNFGRATGLGATRWWTNVIHNTFAPLLAGTGVSIPEDLAPSLLHRFATMEGYTLESSDLVTTLRSLKRPAAALSKGGREGNPLYNQIVVGVVTNSDDRVPGILASAGFAVSPLRYATEEATDPAVADRGSGSEYDIDFHCMSYDVGVEKPDRAIFEAADHILQRVLVARQRDTTCTITTTTTSSPVPQGDGEGDQQAWQKIYVGDEYAKDVVGSLGAGWNSVLLDPQESGSSSCTHEGRIIPELKGTGHETASIADMFTVSPVVSVRSIQDLVRCLRGQC